eukprot:gnl/Spiro4/16238_TR8721_c0_g1_i1.p1 gnl/Spiro4/16238_TR8721_c0_g1~~gnl/Spiro4/16238_TR8721_c0_g1_i1.p1  ORF type:complete len:144 (-),score=40.09 gnl/Spiro4/16238_TR8721_c0_g1_i1:147-578(-)
MPPPYYQILCTSSKYTTVEELARTMKGAATAIHAGGGVVKNIEWLGRRRLGVRMHSHGVWQREGLVTNIQCWSHPNGIHLLERTLRNDEKVVRWSVKKDTDFRPVHWLSIFRDIAVRAAKPARTIKDPSPYPMDPPYEPSSQF